MGSANSAADAHVHVWEKHEIELTCERTYANAYTDATVWVDLTGPGFNKRVYGFWYGGNSFKVRVAATAPGTWHWRSGSEPNDPGLSGKSGSLTATDWTEQEKQANAKIEQLNASGQFAPRRIVTKIEPAQAFWRAEEYHQKYLAKRGQASCHI